jgi:hypothetical protein
MSHFLILFFFLSPSFYFLWFIFTQTHSQQPTFFFPLLLFLSHFLFFSLIMDSSSRILLSSLSLPLILLHHIHMKSMVQSPSIKVKNHTPKSLPIKPNRHPSENHTPKSLPIKPNRHPSNHLKSTPQNPYSSN